MLKIRIGSVVRNLRNEKNMTQEDLATILCVSMQSVSRWENGLNYPDISLLPKIAQVFGVSVDYLLGIVKDNDEEKCKKAEQMIANEMGFDGCVPVSGQTYSRKIDSQIISTLGNIAQSAMKFANDMRILQNFKEMEEPFEKNQIGSSAMPYKRNPMRCERITALARYLMIDTLNPAFTAGTQWFERTLDDSANKRISVAEGFLAADAILNIMINVTSELVVYPKVIRQRIMRELPFMASENIMMDAVKRGGNRQELHEKIRTYAMEAGKQVKEEGLENDLIERILADPSFGLKREDIEAVLVPENYTGRSSEQVTEFLAECVKPVLDKYSSMTHESAEINV